MIAEVPAGWEMTPLSDLGRWTGGGTPSKANPAFWVRKGIPWVSPKDMKRSLIEDAVDHISKAAVAASTTNIVPNSSILVVTRSGILSHSLPVAKTLLPVAINQDLKALVAGKQYDPDFLLYAFRGYEESILRECRKSGTTVANLDTDRLLAFVIPVPPLVEQHRIVAKLDQLFGKSSSAREELAHIPRLVERYKEAILAAALRGDTTAAWRNAHPTAWSSLEREQAVPLTRKREGGSTGAETAKRSLLPNSWKWARVESIGEVILGRQRSPENHEGPNLRPYVRAANITWEGWDLSDVKQMNFDERDFKRFKLHPGDVLINEGSGSADEVGKPAIWNGEIKNCCFQNTLIAVRPHATTSEYLYFVLLNAALSKAFVDEARGVNIHHIGRAGLAQFPIPVPPSEEQQEIVRRIKAAFKVIDKVEEETSRATQLLDRLDRATLEKAFRGELVLSLQTASTVMANSE